MSESKTITVTMSFTGIMRNASDGVKVCEELIESGDFMWDGNEVDRAVNALGNIKTCLSAYHDTILGLLKGDVTLEEARDFWFRGDAEAVKQAAYKGDILKIGVRDA